MKKKTFTSRQGEYLAFISQYRDLVDCSPSEGDIADFFGVSGPSAHQMVVTLAARSLLYRVPGVARGIRLTVSSHVLPLLGGPGYLGADPVAGLTAFAVYVAKRLASRKTSPFASFAAIHLLAARLESFLAPLGASESAVRKGQIAVLRVANARLGRRRTKPPAVPVRAIVQSQPQHLSPSPPAKKPRPRKPIPPGQGSLF